MRDQETKDLSVATLTVCAAAIVLITVCTAIGGCLK